MAAKEPDLFWKKFLERLAEEPEAAKNMLKLLDALDKGEPEFQKALKDVIRPVQDSGKSTGLHRVRVGPGIWAQRLVNPPPLTGPPYDPAIHGTKGKPKSKA